MDLADVGADPSRLIAQVEALRASEPHEPVTATDPSGAVTASLAEDGSLASLEVDRDWRSMVRPSALAGACSAAVDAAVEARRTLWSDRAENTLRNVRGAAAFGLSRQWESHGDATRPLSDLVQYATFDKTRELVTPVETPPRTEPAGPVCVLGTPDGRVDVTIDEAWLERAATALINNELAAAVAKFLDQVTASEDGFEGFRAYNRELDTAFADALAHMARMGEH